MGETRGAHKERYESTSSSKYVFICRFCLYYFYLTKCARFEIFEPEVLIGLMVHIVVEI